MIGCPNLAPQLIYILESGPKRESFDDDVWVEVIDENPQAERNPESPDRADQHAQHSRGLVQKW